MSLRSVFVGAVEGSHTALAAACAAGHVPQLVVTLPPALAGRHSDYADLAPLAARYGVPVHFTAQSNSPATLAAVRAADPDLVMVIGWSQLCGAEFMALPRLGCLGFHPSLLPRLRGRGVIPWTVLLGEREAGATLFWLGAGTDDGPIAAQARYAIDPGTVTAAELYRRATGALAELLPPLLADIAAGGRPAAVQDESAASLCARRRPEDGRICWQRPAADIHRLIRAAGPPYPGAFTRAADGRRLVLTAVRHCARPDYYIGLPGQVQAVAPGLFTVACGDGACLDITKWHWEGPDGPEQDGTELDGTEPDGAGAGAPPALHSKLGEAP